MKKFFEEFKAFALKGNMMDMAIGVIIGGAFSTLVTPDRQPHQPDFGYSGQGQL